MVNDRNDEGASPGLGGPLPAAGRAEDGVVEEFIQLHSAARERLFSYALAISPSWHDAEEIMQEASLILWRKFDTFGRSTNFFAWACQVIRYELYNRRRRESRRGLVFSNEAVERIADIAAQQGAEFEDRCEALRLCLQHLPSADQKLIELRYHRDASTATVAERTNRPLESVYKSLQRIRRALMTCVERRLTAGM